MSMTVADFPPIAREAPARPALAPAPPAPQAEVRALFDVHVDKTKRHESNLIGNGFLRRGHGLLFPGPTGHGKSTLMIEAMMKWGLAGDLFGLRAPMPLSSLYVQAENDDEDIEEIREGIVRGLKLCPADVEQLRRRMFVTTTHERGPRLFQAIEPIVMEKKPDLLVIDPLLAFFLGEINNQEHASAFLRQGLQPFLTKHKLGAILVHHTPKPARVQPGGKAPKAFDLAYSGAGSAEFANWSRAVMSLVPLGNDLYDLVIGKRFKRAGIVDAHGRPVDTIKIRHSREPGAICWEPATLDQTATTQVLAGAEVKKRTALFTAFYKMKKDVEGAVPLAEVARKISAGETTLRRWFRDENNRIELGGDVLRRLDDGRIQLEDAEEGRA